jgi:hypothetical protein
MLKLMLRWCYKMFSCNFRQLIFDLKVESLLRTCSKIFDVSINNDGVYYFFVDYIYTFFVEDFICYYFLIFGTYLREGLLYYSKNEVIITYFLGCLAIVCFIYTGFYLCYYFRLFISNSPQSN